MAVQTVASGAEDYLPLQDEASVQARIEELAEKEQEIALMLDAMDKAFASRREPLEEERACIAEEKAQLLADVVAKSRKAAQIYPPAPGPSSFQFVDSGWFLAICNVVVVVNLAAMAFSNQLQAYHSTLYVFDQFFLLWYVFELTAKWTYHRSDLFFGSISVVWWNWLDASIVIGGVLDQWLMLLVQDLIPWKIPALSNWLRWLRLFRIMRFLKVLRAFLEGDTTWTEKAPFQLCMSAVIAVNSIVLALELDYDEWNGWPWVEQVFLVIYTFELAVRMKGFGLQFFVNADLVWNNLDFAMVCGGAFDMWLMPAWRLILTLCHRKVDDHNGTITNIVRILRMAKILRVLRLVRLLRMVKPLYTLLIGVMSALDAMKWVMMLTLFLLYAGAIVFTSLIGHGYIYDNIAEVPPEAELYFGSVAQSIFSLFKLMNGDTTVVIPITKNAGGRLLFAAFMILSNWAVLAILTSVVSDHMISSSQQIVEEDRNHQDEEELRYRTMRLRHFFSRLDTDKDGRITPDEWAAVVQHPELSEELCHLTKLSRGTLKEVIHCLIGEENSKDFVHGADEPDDHFCPDEFISYLNRDKEPADQRQILHLRYCLEVNTMNRIQELEGSIKTRFDDLEKALFPERVVTPEEAKGNSKVRPRYPRGNSIVGANSKKESPPASVSHRRERLKL